MINDAPDYIVEFLANVSGVVEATSFEKYCLWKDYHEEMKWDDNNSGYGYTVGMIGDNPIHLSLLTSVIDGQKILFYHATSRVVDHDIVRAWIDHNMPVSAFLYHSGIGCEVSATRLNHTDAQNFHNVLRG